MKTAIAAKVKELHLGHRDPSRNDVDIARLDAFVRELMRQELHLEGRPGNSCSGRIVPEGLVVRLGEDESM